MKHMDKNLTEEERETRPFTINGLPAGHKGSAWIEVGSRAGGQSWRLPVLYITGEEEGPTLVVTAGVHGDEYEGVETIPRVFDQVEPDHLRGRLVMVPVCNIPAYEVAQRNSPIDGLNLARVFPGDKNGTITQRIAHVLVEEILRHADFYIDLHSGGIAYRIPTLVGYIGGEDDRARRSLVGARAFGAPVIWEHPPPQPPGRTLSITTELGIPSLYTEAPGGGYARPEDVECFLRGVLNVLRHLSMLGGEPQTEPLTHDLYGSGDLDYVTNAPASGFFRAEVDLLDTVAKGQRLGVIYDLFGEEIGVVKADGAGIVILLRRLHRVHVGESVAHVTGFR